MGSTWSRQPPGVEATRELGGLKRQEIRALLPFEAEGQVLAFGEEIIDPSTGVGHAQLWIGLLT